MNRFLRNRLVLQLLFTFVAALLVTTLSVELVTEAIGSAESVVVGEAGKVLSTATSELKQQYHYRANSDSFWHTLPEGARDISLRGITQTVLRSYPGVEGGFYSDSAGFLGYAYPTHDTGNAKIDVPTAERDMIVSVAEESIQRGGRAQRVIRGRTDLLIIASISGSDKVATWAMKRIVGRGAPGMRVRDVLLAVLVLAALVSIVGSLMTGLSLARGVTQIKAGLARLENNFDFRLPERTDELGSISHSINQMASVRTRLEAELRREERLRALGRLAAGLAHEIRNPLNSIRLTVQLLEHRLHTGSIRAEDLRTVRTEVDRLGTLLNDLLDLQRTRQPRPELQPVRPVVEHCLTLVKRQAEMQNTAFVFEDAGVEHRAFFDSQQLSQTIVNLLLNALEASPERGAVRVRLFAQNGTVHVEVKDEGAGLGPEQTEHLFEPFYTTKPSGTGLGLAVSRELMRSQGGDLRYNDADRGACFVVDLPRMRNV